jgi:hypothetical protein
MSATPVDKRRCRTCGESYSYPGHKSLATRSTCAQCVEISPELRRVLQLFRTRLDRLDSALEALTRKTESD